MKLFPRHRLLGVWLAVGAACSPDLEVSDARSALVQALPTAGDQSVLVLRVRFADDLPTQGPLPEATLRDLFTRRVIPAYTEMSAGRVTLVPTFVSATVGPVAQYLNGSSIDARAVIQAAVVQASVDPSAFDHVVLNARIVFPGNGGSTVEPGVVAVFNTDDGSFIHELGHNYGAQHAGFLDAPGASFGSPTDSFPDSLRYAYGNVFDPMGGPRQAAGAPGAATRRRAGFMPSTDVQFVSGEGVFRLAPLSSATGATRALEIDRGHGSRHLLVEYRPDLSHLDASHSVLVGTTTARGEHRLIAARYHPEDPWLVESAPLRVGQTLIDPYAQLALTALTADAGTSADVEVRRVVASNAPPTLSVSASTVAVAPGIPMTFTATASDPDADPLTFFWDFGDGTFSTNGSPTQTRSWASPRHVWVRCEVSDRRGGRRSEGVLVTIGTPSTVFVSGTVSDGVGPVEDARVLGGPVRPMSTTAGAFVITGLTPGVVLNARVFAANRSFPASIPLVPNTSLVGVQLLGARRTFSIGGRVWGVDGQPVVGARVGAGALTAVSDATGRWRLTGLSPQRLRLSAQHRDEAFTVSSSAGLDEQVDVGGNDLGALDFYGVGAVSSVQVRSGGTSQPLVSVGSRVLSAGPAGAGVFSASTTVSPGWKLVAATQAGARLAPRFTNPVQFPTEAQPLFEEATANEVRVFGRVRTPGAAVSRAHVMVGARTAVTDDDGAWELWLPPGPATLVVQGPAGLTFAQPSRSVTVALPQVGPIDFVSNEVNQAPVVELPRIIWTGSAYRLEATATDDEGSAALVYRWLDAARPASRPDALLTAVNGTNAARVALVTRPGSDEAVLEVRDGRGGVSRVGFRFEARLVPTGLRVRATGTPTIGALVPLGVELLDEWGRVMPMSIRARWSVAGPATVSTSPLFGSVVTVTGPGAVTVTARTLWFTETLALVPGADAGTGGSDGGSSLADGGATRADAGVVDAGSGPDGGNPPVDAGLVDAGLDAGAAADGGGAMGDAGLVDGGTSVPDSGANAVDAGPEDAGLSDGGLGRSDAGRPGSDVSRGPLPDGGPGVLEPDAQVLGGCSSGAGAEVSGVALALLAMTRRRRSTSAHLR